MEKQPYTFRKTVLSALFFILVVLVVSCNKAPEADQAVDMRSESAPAVYQDMEMKEEAVAGSPDAIEQAAYARQKIIRNANVRFQVSDYRKSIRNIENSLNNYNAFIVSSNESRMDNSLHANLIIKVPARNLDNLLNKLTEESINLDYKNISSEDVTTEFVDISARLKAKKAVEQRYLDLLNQAKTIKDILEIENQLRVIREEIEGVQARINYINQQSALSTIHLAMYETKAGAIGGSNFGIRILNALKTGWDMLLNLFIGVLYLWPFLLLIPAGIFVIRWFLRKQRAGR